ncbi:deoxycytidylate deaminase [Streptomyces phyllanthi]|uniref:Deoxycytidylate deaminase n=1 Tax=Streptomyces phyllanthi TaxID=1803180 RepID=A0A5N8W041_9ACTN|nr:deoxycytidylate deaminase [Streptomyces phyllanthi]
MKQTILYLPVVHAGYEAFLSRHADSDEILILGSGFASVFRSLTKEIRALSPERAVEYVRMIAHGPRVRLIEPADIPDAVFGDVVVLPDEEIMHTLAGMPDFPSKVTCHFDSTFLRWDREWSRAGKPAHFDGSVSRAVLDRTFLDQARRESQRSSDWWRQVGAVAARNGQVLKASYNHHHPTEYAPYIDGDPRNEFSRGVRPDLSTAIHAEASLVARAARDGLSLAGADLYVSTFPCPSCARIVVEAGFRRCFFAGPYSMLDGETILRAGDIELIWVDMEPEPVIGAETS